MSTRLNMPGMTVGVRAKYVVAEPGSVKFPGTEPSRAEPGRRRPGVPRPGQLRVREPDQGSEADLSSHERPSRRPGGWRSGRGSRRIDRGSAYGLPDRSQWRIGPDVPAQFAIVQGPSRLEARGSGGGRATTRGGAGQPVKRRRRPDPPANGRRRPARPPAQPPVRRRRRPAKRVFSTRPT
jgi:hypothetical protein